MSARSTLTLTQTRIAQGIWEGVLTGVTDAPPTIEARVQDRMIGTAELTALPGKPKSFAVRLPLPATVLNEGLQTVLFIAGEEVLAQFTILAETPLDPDLRAEISLLRAELDLLKRAFRRHCAEQPVKDQIS
jgi:hypothetical protein